jgi:hypothetical protein
LSERLREGTEIHFFLRNFSGLFGDKFYMEILFLIFFISLLIKNFTLELSLIGGSSVLKRKLFAVPVFYVDSKYVLLPAIFDFFLIISTSICEF